MKLPRDLLVGLALLIAMPAWAQVGIPTPIATTGIAGKVKPDGTSISVASDGTISTLGAPPSGAAGGDLGGTYPNPTVTSGAHLSGSLASGLTIPSATLTAPALGTPASGVATNLTGTAAGLTAGSVTTNANLTGPVTSTGNATAVNATAIATAAAWTPTDASGAGLTFTNVSAKYVQIGPMVFAWASLTYPSTADGSNAAIGGLPVAVANYTGAQTGSVAYGISFTPSIIQPQANTSTAFFWVNDALASRRTNATLSTITVSFLLIYPAS